MPNRFRIWFVGFHHENFIKLSFLLHSFFLFFNKMFSVTLKGSFPRIVDDNPRNGFGDVV